ncbi:MAG: ribbon-helix-helix domain-containing protein, partial [Promethearchaeota archaeon]
MPIISISLNESLKKFINKLVNRNQYENKSKLIRDALLRLMSTEDVSAALEGSAELIPTNRNIIGNMIIVAPNE